MKCFAFAGNACIFLLAFLFLLQVRLFGQCAVTLDSRENITTNTTQISGAKSKSVSGNNLNVAYTNQGNGAKLTLSFSGSNNTYSNDTIRFIGSMTLESISRNNNTLNGTVFVVTENSNITFKTIDINNGSNIRFINYGIMTFQNSFSMPANTSFVNKLASSVLTFNNAINFANNSNTTVLYSNGGIINFSNGFTLQSNNKICLTGYTQVNTTSITNNVANGIYVPVSFSACIKYTSSATLNNTLTNGPGFLYIAQKPGASEPASLIKWGTSIVNTTSSGCNIILPLVLKDFVVIAQGKYALVKWSTSSEQNSSSFEIERSIDGTNFKSIGRVLAKGYSNVLTEYSFSDLKITERIKYFYRLKMIDKDGKYTYSGVKEISLSETNNKLKAVISGGKIVTHFPSVKNSSVLFICDVLGKIVYHKNLLAGETTVIVNYAPLIHGNYFVVLISDYQKESVHIVY